MQVYLPAIEGCVPSEMVWALQALIHFIYIAQCNIIDSNSIKGMDGHLIASISTVKYTWSAAFTLLVLGFIDC